MKNYFFALFLLIGLSSCKTKGNYIPDSKGNPYEILMVAENQMQKSAPCDTLREILSEDVDMINQSEPIYDIITTTPDNLKNILELHRNIIILEVSEKFDSASIKVEYNKFSAPQMIVYMQAKTDSSLASYIAKNGQNIVTLFNKEEQKRMVARMTKRNNPPIIDTIKSMFGIDIQIPTGYTIRKRADNFLWISYETPATSQGIFIYTYFYDSTETFTQKYAIDVRNSFASMIPGARDSSYMTTSTVFPPTINTTVINGRQWVEQHGFWDVKGDYMGGPFVSFSAVDKKNNRVIVIDEYLYSPRTNKKTRNLLRQLENIVYSVKIP
ncbi:MAG: DUF4837 family protein [Rikenellaceae bacterium]